MTLYGVVTVNVSAAQVELADDDAKAEVNSISGEIAPNVLVKKHKRITTEFQLMINFMFSYTPFPWKVHVIHYLNMICNLKYIRHN